MLARKVAARACHLRFDGQIPEPARQFFYLPLMHSESQMDQDRAVRMFLLRMPQTGAQNLLHARAHRAVIREFGRFPYRNTALGRETTSAEQAFCRMAATGQRCVNCSVPPDRQPCNASMTGCRPLRCGARN